MALFSWLKNSVAVVIGVGLMGQRIAKALLEDVGVMKLILVDVSNTLTVGTAKMSMTEFVATLPNPRGAEIVTVVASIENPQLMAAIFAQYKDIKYIVITSGISPHPLTPPEKLGQADYEKLFRVNTWGPINVINEACKAGAFAKKARGVILLSTSATHGAQGRAGSDYEVSKGGLANWVQMQSRHYLDTYDLVLNGISPNPLEGPMASANPVSAGRVDAVRKDSPMGLTNADNVALQTLSYFADNCNSVGQNIVICGGYTLPHPVYGPLPGTAAAADSTKP